MRKIQLLIMLVVLTLAVNLSAMTTEEFQSHADSVIDRFARFDPVWGTYLGIHDYDAHLADYSPSNVAKYTAYLESELKLLAKVDTSGWDIDNSIDYRLLIANIKMQIFQLKTFPYWRKSPSIYSDQCVQGIYYLVLRDFAPLEERLRSFLGRLEAIPGVCRIAKTNLNDAVPIFIETSIESLDEGINLITSTGQMFAEKFPERKLEIDKATNKAAMALRDFNTYCRKIKGKAKGSYAIGKKNFEFLLKDIHMLDMNSDSLLNIGYAIYDKTNADIDSIASQLPPSDTMPKFAIPNLAKKDVFGYYQWEINKVSDFIKARKLITIPDDLGNCIPVETPPFLRATVRGIAYEGPGVFDSIQTGHFYVRPLPDSFSDEQKSEYVDYIARRAFRGSVVHEAFPGHHLQLTLANRKHSKIRKIQQDLVMVEGWALYCEQMMYEQGLYGKDLRQWNGVLGGIRFRAVRIIVDMGLQTGRFTPETALTYMNEKLGENVYYYTAEIRRYCAYPTSALSYLTGKTMIMRLKERVAAREGDSFNLQDFHDKFLSEGSIPIPLIAEKYAW